MLGAFGFRDSIALARSGLLSYRGGSVPSVQAAFQADSDPYNNRHEQAHQQDHGHRRLQPGIDPETCLPSASDDTFALNLTRTAMPPYHPGSGIARSGATNRSIVFTAVNVTMPMPDMPDIASAG